MKKYIKFFILPLFVFACGFIIIVCDLSLDAYGNSNSTQPTEPFETNSGTTEITLADCENGKIVLHENLSWMRTYTNEPKGFYQAVGDSGYYFERWTFLDKNMNEVETDFGHLAEGTGETIKIIKNWEMYANYLYKSKVDNFFNSPWRTDIRNSALGKDIAYLTAIFTNDESKLVDVELPPLQVQDTYGNEITNYSINEMPDKKVIGTRLWQYVIIDSAEIVKTYKGVGFSSGYYNVIVEYADVHLFQENMAQSEKNAYSYFDYQFFDAFDSVVEWIIIVADIHK